MDDQTLKLMVGTLNILVWTLSITIILGMIGVFLGKVDPQYIEGLVSGALVTLITMLIKDLMNNTPIPPPTPKA